MNDAQKLLVNILSCAIRGNIPEKDNVINIDWNEIFEEAKAQDVYTIVYPAVKELVGSCKEYSKLMVKWEKTVLWASMTQIQFLEEIKGILESYNREGIPVIVLKGLMIRKLYPQPEFRTMVDADLLINIKDLHRAKDLLLRRGYAEDDINSKHIKFIHLNRSVIELHWQLANHSGMLYTGVFNERIWNNPIQTEFLGVQTLSLSLEDSFIHICIHMAEHMVSYGFGLKLLCDLVLFVENYGDRIDWSLIKENIKEFGIERFTFACLTLCKELFGMNIPYELCNLEIEGTLYLELLKDDILFGGVHGYEGMNRYIGNSLLRYSTSNDSMMLWNDFLSYLSFLFPQKSKLRKRYSYAQKWTFLIPVAWAHRLISNICRKDIISVVKTAFLSPSKTASILEKRISLLRWLNLK